MGTELVVGARGEGGGAATGLYAGCCQGGLGDLRSAPSVKGGPRARGGVATASPAAVAAAAVRRRSHGGGAAKVAARTGWPLSAAPPCHSSGATMTPRSRRAERPCARAAAPTGGPVDRRHSRCLR